MAPLIRFGSRQIRCIDSVTKNTNTQIHKINNNNTHQQNNKPSNNNNNKKSVSFHKSVKVRLSIHINEYTDKEVDACWYSREEFQAIRADMKMTSALIKRGALSNQDTEHYCRRGVECKMGQSLLRKQQLRTTGWHTVLCEQHLFQQLKTRQERSSSFSHDDSAHYIAEAYRVVSASALSIARATALKDEMEV